LFEIIRQLLDLVELAEQPIFGLAGYRLRPLGHLSPAKKHGGALKPDEHCVGPDKNHVGFRARCDL